LLIYIIILQYLLDATVPVLLPERGLMFSEREAGPAAPHVWLATSVVLLVAPAPDFR